MTTTITVIAHEYDPLLRQAERRYLMEDMLGVLKEKGCEIAVTSDLSSNISSGIVVAHIDATHVPAEYSAFAQRHALCLNSRVTDISKGVISDALVKPGDDWAGPVIVKTQLNYRGVPERGKNQIAHRLGKPLPFARVGIPPEYTVYRSIDKVPPEVWTNPSLIVDRFMPERMKDGFAMCHYVFCGSYEFCGRFIGTEPLVKGANVFRHEVFEVPDYIRQRRRELGFDYGKFDFVERDGRIYLIDANKTPGRIPPSGGASLEAMADGLLGFLRH